MFKYKFHSISQPFVMHFHRPNSSVLLSARFLRASFSLNSSTVCTNLSGVLSGGSFSPLLTSRSTLVDPISLISLSSVNPLQHPNLVLHLFLLHDLVNHSSSPLIELLITKPTATLIALCMHINNMTCHGTFS